MSVEQKVERNGWAIRVVAGDQKGGSNAEVTIHVGDEPTAARIVLEGGHSGAAREFLARFPEKEDGA